MQDVPLVGSVSMGFSGSSPITPPEYAYKSDQEGLKKASADFVAILFSNMFKEMRGTPEQSDPDSPMGSLFGGSNVDMFIGFLDQEIGKKFASEGGSDLVNTLYEQLKGDREIKKDAFNSILEERKQIKQDIIK